MAKCNKSLSCAVVAREKSEELTQELNKEQSEALHSSQQDWDQAETHRWTTQCHQQTDDKLQEYQPTPRIEGFLPLKYFPFFKHKGGPLEICVCLFTWRTKKNKKKNMFLYKIHTEPFSYFYGHYNCTETERDLERVTAARGQVLRTGQWGRVRRCTGGAELVMCSSIILYLRFLLTWLSFYNFFFWFPLFSLCGSRVQTLMYYT